MIVYLNGRFIPEERAVISIHDRGFLYGDGLFETVRIYNGRPFLWEDHAARFEHGCKVLQITPPLTVAEIRRVTLELVQRNSLRDALARFTLSRGSGPRGYSPRGAEHPTLLITPFPTPEPAQAFRVIIATVALPDEDRIAGFKHLNKLHQVVARAEADAVGANEALLTNLSGRVIEGATTNLFWVNRGTVETPPLSSILAGTTRAHVLRLCRRLQIPARECHVRPEELARMEGIFVTSCGAEITEVGDLDGRPVARSPLVTRLRRHYRDE